MRLNPQVSNSSTKTAEAPVYGYAKRPRTRAANRLNRLENPNWRNEAKFLNDYMEAALGWSSLKKTVAARVCA